MEWVRDNKQSPFAPQTTVLAMPLEMDGHDEMRFVVLEGERLVATASAANWGAEVVTLFQMYVVKDRQGNGFGRVLVEAACEAARLEDASAVSAVIEEDGPLAFWTGLGFRPAHLEGKRLIVTRFLKGE